MDVMLDIETMSTRLDALVLSIGAVEFSLHPAGPKVHTRMLLVLDVQQQLLLGRHVAQGTQRWWAQQSEQARAHWQLPASGPLPVVEALLRLSEYVRRADADKKDGSTLWANGTVFDVGVLEHLYKQHGYAQPPWYYSNVRDARTTYKVCGQVRTATEAMLQQQAQLHDHDPVDDCIKQINLLWCCWPGPLPDDPEVAEPKIAEEVKPPQP